MNGNEHPKYLWQDGEIKPWAEATVHLTHVGVAGASHIFEGIKAYWNGKAQQLYVFSLEEHMRRFSQGMKITHLRPQVSTERIGQGILELLRANEERRDVYVRPFVFIDQPGPSISGARTDAVPSVAIYTDPFATKLESEEMMSCCCSR